MKRTVREEANKQNKQYQKIISDIILSFVIDLLNLPEPEPEPELCWIQRSQEITHTIEKWELEHNTKLKSYVDLGPLRYRF